MSKYVHILLSLCFAFLLSEPLYAAMTPAQKRAKAKEVQLRKREAAKRKAEKKKAAQQRAAKRQRIKEGKLMLYVYSYDQRTGEPMPGTHITLQDVHARPNKRPLLSKATDQKRARVQRTLPEGHYWIYAARTGYFSADTVYFHHREDEDTIRVSLYPETRLILTVTDSLTSRPVTANIIVRDQNARKVMQTTSDSIHSRLAVLMDDRQPYYTIDATAIGYFPFHDTISDPHTYVGIQMAPREVKSFVLRDMYFATGKTQILESSESALNELYNLLSSRPTQRIRIVGHTDNIGSDRSNQLLSEGRCRSVREAMVERGIDGTRIEILGRGKRDPIVPNDTEEHRQMNRRVEIELL